ncbi:unnamed protein product [Bemisia tabaci]|uniref:Cuticular protein n=1 Tax=Bemisia tabaci TaxID=7038 RepID=A0A9P0CE02_BEMTA|nr:unnamed protein product [Bemisia tabaci]
MLIFGIAISLLAIIEISSAKIEGGWDTDPKTQYHIQTDEGPERYFRYQTMSGQYRKEKRLPDGTVVGSYGWVDPDGYLRLRDYIADDKGYRIVKTKKVFVGKEAPIGNAVASAKYVPSQGGVGVENAQLKPQPPVYKSSYDSSALLRFPTTLEPSSTPISLADYLKSKESPNAIPVSDYLHERKQQVQDYLRFGERKQEPEVVVTPNAYPKPENYSPLSQDYVQPITFRPYFNTKTYNDNTLDNAILDSSYDGVAMTHNGFRYYLPRHYHEEESPNSYQRAGSFGYIDPFGIRRVIYYNTSPGSGFKVRKNNRYVGFNSTPYDPRF